METKAIQKVRHLPLDRTAWIKGALTALAEEGHAGLRVETLAKRLLVTKGSFYWHFRDRRDLVDAVLETWKLARIAEAHQHTTAFPGQEAATLRNIIDFFYSSSGRNRQGLPLELAIREWANRDTLVAAVLAEVDEERARCTARLFEKLGATPDEATARSILICASTLGFSLMHCDNFIPDSSALKAWLSNYIAPLR
jgi:AcrR family transcriptional regulator